MSLYAKGKVLVSGASGFIGGRIVEILHLTGYRPVKAGIRRWSSAARLGRFPVEFTEMDLMDREQIERALRGVTEIIHCAKGPSGVTEHGTKNLLEISSKKPIRRFVHLSTTEVYGSRSGVITEDTPFEYTGNEYNRTKIEAEKACLEYINMGFPVTIVRPSVVYGPFSTQWTVRIARMLIAGQWVKRHENGNGMCNLVYVDDLVRAILLVMEHDDAVGHAFNINGPDVVTWNEYFERFNLLLGLPQLREIGSREANLRAVVKRCLKFAEATHMAGPIRKLVEREDFGRRIVKQARIMSELTPTPSELRLFSKNAIFSGEKAHRMLNFCPTYSLDHGLRIAVDWLAHNGLTMKVDRPLDSTFFDAIQSTSRYIGPVI